MKHHSTQTSSSEEELKNLIYSPDKDDLEGIERYNDIFSFLENNTFEVDEEIVGKVLSYASSFNSSED